MNLFEPDEGRHSQHQARAMVQPDVAEGLADGDVVSPMRSESERLGTLDFSVRRQCQC